MSNRCRFSISPDPGLREITDPPPRPREGVLHDPHLPAGAPLPRSRRERGVRPNEVGGDPRPLPSGVLAAPGGPEVEGLAEHGPTDSAPRNVREHPMHRPRATQGGHRVREHSPADPRRGERPAHRGDPPAPSRPGAFGRQGPRVSVGPSIAEDRDPADGTLRGPRRRVLPDRLRSREGPLRRRHPGAAPLLREPSQVVEVGARRARPQRAGRGTGPSSPQRLLSFRGVPLACVFDDPKAVVISRHGGQIRWNDTFARVALDYRLGPELCTPRRGQEKGSVENLVGVVKTGSSKSAAFRIGPTSGPGSPTDTSRSRRNGPVERPGSHPRRESPRSGADCDRSLYLPRSTRCGSRSAWDRRDG